MEKSILLSLKSRILDSGAESGIVGKSVLARTTNYVGKVARLGTIAVPLASVDARLGGKLRLREILEGGRSDKVEPASISKLENTLGQEMKHD